MRGVPVIDTSGLQAMEKLYDDLTARDAHLLLAAANDDVVGMLERGGLLAKIGRENVFWSADQAIVAAEQRQCAYCAAETGRGVV
jgi:SulP family sulfate permease